VDTAQHLSFIIERVISARKKKEKRLLGALPIELNLRAELTYALRDQWEDHLDDEVPDDRLDQKAEHNYSFRRGLSL
jgi:hypothetical protein